MICRVGEGEGASRARWRRGAGGELQRRREESGRPVGIEETKGTAAARGWVVVALGGRKLAVILRVWGLFFGVCGVILREGRSSFVFVVCFCCCKVKRNGTRRGLCHKLNHKQKKIGTRKWCVFEVER